MDATELVLFLGRAIFLATNILLLYVFLTPKRSLGFQIGAFAATWIGIFVLRSCLERFELDLLLLGYFVGSFYLLPCVLIFKESLQAKVFVFFMNFSLSQAVYLICTYIDRFVEPDVPRSIVLLGLILELASVPLLFRYLKPTISEIIGSIDRQNFAFTLFPLISFMLLAYHGVQRVYTASSFAALLLSSSMILFSYQLIAKMMIGTRRQRQLELLAMTDKLTGLYNRRHMETVLEAEFERYKETGDGFVLISLDIDHFKRVNDFYGHVCGDFLLKAVSEELSKTVRTTDVVARWGGEEFLLLLPQTESVYAAEVAERIRLIIEKRSYDWGNEKVGVTVTLGVCEVSADDTLGALIKKTDLALYQGKKQSRNCVMIFDDGIEAKDEVCLKNSALAAEN